MGNPSKEGAARSKVPRSFSAPYSSSQDHSAEPLTTRHPPDPFLYPSPLHAVALQNSLLRSPLYEDAAFPPAAPQARGFHPADPEGGLEAAFGPEFQFYSEAASHCHKVEGYISRLLRRRSQLVRGSKPRTSLGSEPPGAPKGGGGGGGGGPARQNSFCKRPTELLPPAPAERKHPPSVERGSSTPSPSGHEGGGSAATARIWASWDAAAEGSLGAQSGACEDYSPPQPGFKKPPKLQALAAHVRPASLDHYEAAYPPSPLPDGEDGASRRNGQDPAAAAYEPQDGACLMVKAQYIPAQQPTRAQQAHHRAGKKKPPPLTKGRSVELSPERTPLSARERPRAAAAPPKKCRFTEEGGEGPGRKGAAGGRRSSPRSRKAAARSQSENSLLNKPGVKYGTAEREEAALKAARQRRPHGQAAGGYRKWRSTAEICQEEPSAGGGGGGGSEPRRGRAGPGVGAVGYGYAGSDSECSGEAGGQAPVCRLEEGLAYADSESSLSESPPPYSSGASSDTDESGGLVWPQQLSPQLVSASGPGKSAGGQPKVFVKIKASHALKKKILRFRSGSLKVMTTV